MTGVLRMWPAWVVSLCLLMLIYATQPMSIWYKRGWGLTLKALLDGLIYAAVTAGTFVWLWPN